MIQIKELSKDYTVNTEAIPVLKGLTCTIEQGEFMAILGPSGCGKSTLLNILAGLSRADSGEILIDGKATRTYTDGEWDNLRKRDIGIIFQSFHLIPHLSALENVELAMGVAAWGKHRRRKRAKELLERVGLKDRMKYRPNQLSGGQKQRVAIARALANGPDLILADEPTGALDHATSLEIMSLLRSLNREEHVTILMVTHDEEMASLTDRNIRMLDGEIVEDVRLEPGYEDAGPADETGVTNTLPEGNEGRKGMRFMDSIAMAVRNICLKKKRSVLTILGIAVGICSVVTMLGVTSGVLGKVDMELKGVADGTQIRVVTQGHTEEEIADLKQTMESLRGVKSTEEVYHFAGSLVYGGESFGNELVNSRSKETKGTELIGGRYPVAEQEITINEALAGKLAGDKKPETMLGRKITVYVSYLTSDKMAYAVEESCMVTGITKANLLGTGNNVFSEGYAASLAAASAGTGSRAQDLYVRLKEESFRESILHTIKKMGYETASSEELIQTIYSWIGAVKDFLLLITGISLAVAAVMVVIVQYMSVAERTREIGILRALGAGKREVRNLFLLEAGIIGLVAGLMGIGVSGAIGGLANGVVLELMKEKAFEVYTVNTGSLFGCLTASIMLCIMAGYVPAKGAATVDTIEVLR